MYPDFLVIGAQKAGTTWLDRNLRGHPEVWLPPEKEIHYFDLPRPWPFAALLFAPSRPARHWAKARLKRDWAKVAGGEQTKEWFFRYYFFPRGDGWYGSLFKPRRDEICGESTPRYATLSEKEIRHTRGLMPNLKIVYLLRDPIDRMWSDLAMFQRPRFGGQGLRKADHKTVHDFLSNPENLAHSLYQKNLSRWLKHFAAEQVFIGFQDEVSRNPRDLLHRLALFLGVNPRAFGNFPNASERINSKSYPALDGKTARFLAEQLAEDVFALHGRLCSPFTAAWKQRIEKCLSQT